jgi:glycerol-3-phosphate acyltransferase PlsX
LARIALDAMGGDFAPQATVAGALLALAELDPAHCIQLVGSTSVVEAQLRTLLEGELAAHAAQRDRLTIVEAPDVIEMTDKPSAVVRGKPNSSMAVGLRLQAEGKSDAFVSAGNTGAQMVASMVMLRMHAGLERPAIVTLFPSARKPVAVLDSGANVDCGAEELVQFARLGATYVECVLGRANPAVGLLSIGEEPEKGNAVTKEAHQLLQTSGLNFIGNVEGRDLPAGGTERDAVDVVVCDGFVGNVVLKFYEAIAPLMIGTLRSAGVSSEQLQAGLKHLDYSEYGGAPLLGVKGVSIISHGKSSPRAIKNAVKVAAQAVVSGMNDQIGARLAAAAENAA